MSKSIIYLIENIHNKKKYVGCTITTLEKRFKEHVSKCKQSNLNTKLCNSFRKYGVDSFTFKVLETCDVEDMYVNEIRYIKELDTFKTGLNSTVGGEGCLGYRHTKDIREKISQKLMNGKSHKGKTYKEIYGEDAEYQKNLRSSKTKKWWDNLDNETKKNRVNKVKDGVRKKSKYTVEQIKEYKKKINEGMSFSEFNNMYPNNKVWLYYCLKNGTRWGDI
jgi:group I intron endonuclease